MEFNSIRSTPIADINSPAEVSGYEQQELIMVTTCRMEAGLPSSVSAANTRSFLRRCFVIGKPPIVAADERDARGHAVGCVARRSSNDDVGSRTSLSGHAVEQVQSLVIPPDIRNRHRHAGPAAMEGGNAAQHRHRAGA